MPNKRHPVTTAMLNTLHKKIQTLPEDSYLSALYDWLVIGMQAGQRKSEWCQDASLFRKHKSVALSVKKTPLAFIAKDFTLSSRPSSQHQPSESLPYNYLTITWRFQKNGQNGQQVSFAHNYSNPHLSPVLAAQRILARAKRLDQHPDSPLAIYSSTRKNSSPSSSFQYILHSQVEKSLQSIASQTYDVHDIATLKQYTCHSIRVGACVLLHSSGADSTTIKFRLRWRSDSFIEYLRNTPRLAALHTQIVNAIDTDNLTLS